jgi:hypothetical protein
MAPLLKPGGLQAAVGTFHPEHQAEAERLLRARVAVVELLCGIGPFAGTWREPEPVQEAAEPTAVDLATEAVVRSASALGQVSVLDAAVLERELERIAAIDADHPLVRHADVLLAACEPMDVQPVAEATAT